ncbi:hypothetical protein D7B24_000369 [Verticillium nonalfalfae]|uniref:DUF1445 domain-containing protein n=1 Tax=Verticillium nonalfalfae TaxID=1051616 RepID=A0A3M9Y424_9PEZI|nr:uncharacterized protein D7B24_000369 [Verticillium nonalfalfae]RNJ54526.1 hypothetical protein D7B24_000369 [Verticillium nonalfalfae]
MATITETSISETASRGTTIANPSTYLETGIEARLAARNNQYTKSTSGLAPRHLQANLIILPSRYADDFRDLCARNPVPCPLIAESRAPGDFTNLKSHVPGLDGHRIAQGLDMRTDCPRFNVYQNARLAQSGVPDILRHWTDDHVAFVIGCSYSFESALAAQGLPPRHALLDRNVPMYRSSIPLNPSGVFTGATYVVSMRPYRRADIERIRTITKRYLPTHGECVAWGWDALERLGIKDVNVPQWGDAPLTMDGRMLGDVAGDEENVPVFWGCGVTPQEAVMRADLEGTVMAHAPGHMLVLDCMEDEVLK